MKAFLMTGFIGISSLAGIQSQAQDIRSSEVIIRRDGDKTTKMTIEIVGDSVSVNGKPFNEMNDNGVSIQKRKMIIRGDEIGNMDISGMLDGMNLDGEGNFSNLRTTTDSIAFLGVNTEADERGAKIVSVIEKSAAEKAGLKAGDILTEINDVVVKDPTSLASIIQKHHPKEEVTISYIRKDKTKKTKATLHGKVQAKKNIMIFRGRPGAGNRMEWMTPPGMLNDTMDLEGILEGLSDVDGMKFPFGNLPKKQKLGIKSQDTEDEKGVKVLDILAGSAAEKAGLKVNDIITEVGGIQVNNTDDMREGLHELEDQNKFLLKVNRNGNPIDLEVVFPKKLNTAEF